MQFRIDFDARLPPSAQLGMAQADENAKAEWRREIDGCILAVARRLPDFTVDDVLAEFESLKLQHLTHNLSALGPRMVECSKTMQYMKGTQEFRRSLRPSKHGNLQRVWQSNLFTVPGLHVQGS